MNERIKKLRAQSVNAVPSISSERAELITDFYVSGAADAVSLPVARAMALKYVITHREICINDGELIVGERGPLPKATPTYPELCCHSLDDLDVVTARDRTPFTVSEDVRKAYAKTVIPFWSGRTLREKLFAAMSPQWHDAFDAKAASWTGVSTPELLGGDDPQAVRDEVRHCVDVFGDRGFILGVTNSIRNHFPWENTLAMIDEWKKLR